VESGPGVVIRADGKSEPKLVHQRTMKMEIAVTNTGATTATGSGMICRRPLSEDTWVAGYNVHDGSRLWYHVPPNHWSVHYNASPDSRSSPATVPIRAALRAGEDAKWMFLFHPSSSRIRKARRRPGAHDPSRRSSRASRQSQANTITRSSPRHVHADGKWARLPARICADRSMFTPSKWQRPIAAFSCSEFGLENSAWTATLAA